MVQMLDLQSRGRGLESRLFQIVTLDKLFKHRRDTCASVTKFFVTGQSKRWVRWKVTVVYRLPPGRPI